MIVFRVRRATWLQIPTSFLHARSVNTSRSGLELSLSCRGSLPPWKHVRLNGVRLYSSYSATSFSLDRSICRLKHNSRKTMFSLYSTSQTNGHSVRPVSEGRELLLKLDSAADQDMLLHAVWLRHNCQCSSCVFSSVQKLVKPTILDPSLTISKAEIAGEQVKVSWSCGHHGYIGIDLLRENLRTTTSVDSRIGEDPSTPSIANELPVMSAVGLLEDKTKQWKWLQYLNEFGMCLLTNLGTDEGQVVKLGEIMYNIQSTIYGKVFSVKSTQDAINIAYSTVDLDLHMDLVYYESPPGLQLLHCTRFDDSVDGGESILLDLFPVLEEMREKFPEHFLTLARVPATFQKIHYDREYPVSMVYQRPHIELDKNGKIVRMNWSPPVEGPLKVPHEDIEPYYQAYYCLANMLKESKWNLEFRLKPGEALTFNNRRILHGRKEFILNGGVRILEGVYVNIDEFKSKFHVLCNQLGKHDFPVKQVFNGDST